MKNLLKTLHIPTWLFWLLVAVLVLRIPSFFEPYSYGDEMIYLSLGEAIRQGVPLYKEIHDNKPPLLYILAAISGSLFWFKAILAAWHLVTVVLFWKLAEALFPKKTRLQKVATAIFALLTTLPLLEGNIANAELFMVGPIIAGFLILLTKKLTFKNIFFSGLLFSAATLFKVPAAFDVGAIVLFWLATIKLTNKNLKRIAINSLYLGLGFAIPIAVTFVWYSLRGAFSEYLIAAYLQNFGYLSSWRPDDVKESFLTKNAPLIFRGVMVASVMGILYLKRKKLSKNFIFLTAWLMLTLFAVALSERPYPHYLIQSAAPVSFLLAILFTEKTREQTLVILPLAAAFLVPFYFKFWYYPTTPYYTKFIKFAVGQMPKDQYLSTFGGQVPRNYKIANYITSSTKRKDKVFVWGDSSAIYALSRRLPPGKYVADYHIKDFSSNEETMSVLISDMPEFVIVLDNSSVFPNLNLFLRSNYGLSQEIDDASIWKLLNPKVRSQISS
jgi:hypothetical protein